MIKIVDLTPKLFTEDLKMKSTPPSNFLEPVVSEVFGYLDSGVIWVAVAQLKKCEICGQIAGPETYRTDGSWLWPQYMAHYLHHHGMKLPPEFLEDLKKRDYQFSKEIANNVIKMAQSDLDFE